MNPKFQYGMQQGRVKLISFSLAWANYNERKLDTSVWDINYVFLKNQLKWGNECDIIRDSNRKKHIMTF